MHPPVIDLLDPGGEQRVQLHHVIEFAAGADLDEELIPHGAEHPLDFPSAGRLAGLGMHVGGSAASPWASGGWASIAGLSGGTSSLVPAPSDGAGCSGVNEHLM